MSISLPNSALEQTFLNARTVNKFTTGVISDDILRQLYDLMKWWPTSMNCQPGHFFLLKVSRQSKG